VEGWIATLSAGVLGDVCAAAAGVFAVVILFPRLTFIADGRALHRTLRRALAAIASPRISEHWKERAVPAYALATLRHSLRLSLWLALLAAAFVGAFIAAAWVVDRDAGAAVERLLRWRPQGIATALGIAYLLWARRRCSGAGQADDPHGGPGGLPRDGATDGQGGGLARKAQSVAGPEYPPMERLLHRVALHPLVARVAFDVDAMLVGQEPPAVERPVYVAGLARSGTTLLLEALHGSGAFVSLTYRHMPLITAPLMWERLSRGHRRAGEARERAHGDRVAVDYDSPEAFEDVFWRTVGEGDYIRPHGLLPHHPDAAAVADYRRYVARVLAAAGGPGDAARPEQTQLIEPRSRRYLAKGNNNLLRLAALKRAFPDAVIVTPFRAPRDQARSLLAQHRRFLRIHARDPFGLQYMDWLAHHEFGAHARPFLFDPTLRVDDPAALNDEAYWLRYWASVYGHLLSHHQQDVAWIDYDRFCAAPKAGLARLAAVCGLEADALLPFADLVRPRTRHAGAEEEAPMPAEVAAVHARLRAMAEAK
jgi:hypothetical protein